MIRSFADKETLRLYRGETVRRFSGFERRAKAGLKRLAAAATLRDLSGLSGNRLEALGGDRVGQYSIRINDQWRICFRWSDDGAHEVEIVDYH